MGRKARRIASPLLSDRVLITGAAGALGRAVAHYFLEAGESLLAVDVDEEALAELTPLAPSQRLAVRRADLARGEEVESLFAELARAGRLPRRLVHLVGGFHYALLRDYTDEAWARLLRMNLETTFHLFRCCARYLERGGPGSIVAVASPAARATEAGLGPYGAAKAGVLCLVESLGRELAASGVRVNAIIPGTMDTPANRKAMPDTDPAAWVRPEDVAAVLHFLSSERAAAVSGAAVAVPGPTL